MLPNVKIDFVNGVLGSVGQSEDGVCGLIVLVEEGSALVDTPTRVYTSDCIAKYNITNSMARKAIEGFYAEAGEGAELWLYGLWGEEEPDYTNLTERFLKGSNGRIRTVGVAGYITSDMVEGFVSQFQAIAEQMTTTLYMPVVGLFAVAYSEDLPDLTQKECNRVGIVVGDTEPDGEGGLIGVLLGRVAKTAVQTHIGRVKDGALSIAQAYIGDEKVEESDAVRALHDKGYIVPRCYVGKSGYYFADDCLATIEEDDYRSLARRRVIDKAYRVAYATLVEYINDNLDVTNEGTLTEMSAKAIEQEIESTIYRTMTSAGNLSVDKSVDGDMGVKVLVDTTNDVVGTNTINVSIMVKPYGYAKYIEVELGFLKED